MPAEQVRWYPSKVDRWLVPVLCLPPVAAVAVGIGAALAGSIAGLLVGAAAALFVAGLYLGLVIPTRYGLSDTHLIVSFGVCRQTVVLADITELHPTNSQLSAPALSLDRLHVQYGVGFLKSVMISPADRGAFLDEVATKAGLVRDGERLLRVRPARDDQGA